MKKKVLAAYLGLLLLAFLSNAYSHRIFNFLLPLYLLGLPVLLRGRTNLFFSMKDLGLGALVSAVVLLPFSFLFPAGKAHLPADLDFVLVQLFVVAIPEEAFFRGFLQETLGNTLKGVVVVSLMFAATHLPAFIFSHDPYALLTFFPSLVMGLLYLKTSNILPSALFHFLANFVFRIL